MLYGISSLSGDQVRFFGLAAPGWVLIAIGVHYVARAILREIRA